jgi:hypothetical protein
MLNDNIANKVKISPDPHLIGWNSTMSIQDILNQLELAYGRPSGCEFLQNNALFHLPFCATKAPKRLFWCIEQCQEIQVIADNPYTPMQLMTNNVLLLMTSREFPMKEFEDWETTPNKTYNPLKLFVHGTYARQLVAVQLRTTGQEGYVANQHNHNMYNVLEDGASNTDNDAAVATMTQQTWLPMSQRAALWAESTLPCWPLQTLLLCRRIMLLQQRPSTNCQPTKLQCGRTCRICCCAILPRPRMWQIQLWCTTPHTPRQRMYHPKCRPWPKLPPSMLY